MAPNTAREARALPRAATPCSFRYRDFPANAASFDVALIHRFGKNGRNHEIASVTRLDFVIDLERLNRRRCEKNGAIFAQIDIIDTGF